jgi:preprotein translocase subunit SecE
MGEKTVKAQKKSWFTGLRAEFKRVSWPDKKTLVKQTTAVVSVSLLLGVLISIIDAILQYGIDFLVK